MCTVKNPKGKSITTIPCKDGLYKILAAQIKTPNESATVASAKMSISEAHRKLGHIAHAAVKHAITNRSIMGIQLDTETKPEFCEACAKAKSARQPIPKESKTRAESFGERVHWVLWGPASVKSLDGYSYVAAHIDNATHETKLYF